MNGSFLSATTVVCGTETICFGLFFIFIAIAAIAAIATAAPPATYIIELSLSAVTGVSSGGKTWDDSATAKKYVISAGPLGSKILVLSESTFISIGNVDIPTMTEFSGITTLNSTGESISNDQIFPSFGINEYVS